MTADVNAAVAGARAAGATEFVVEENHGVEMLCNLVLDEIDPEVDVVRGQPRGGATTMAALDDSFDAMFLVGHHAAAGDYPGVCAHTISYGSYKEVRLTDVHCRRAMFVAATGAESRPRSSRATTSGRDLRCAPVSRPRCEASAVARRR
jgi:D-amino peptidase